MTVPSNLAHLRFGDPIGTGMIYRVSQGPDGAYFVTSSGRPGLFNNMHGIPDVANHIYGAGERDIIYGNNLSDKIFGWEGNDFLYGLDGSDTLHGGVGIDRLYGGAGDDTLYGGVGNDWLYGGAGGDTLHGGPGNDRLYGGAGDDHLHGGVGRDRLVGDTGRDIFYVGADNALDIIIDFQRGEDQINIYGLQNVLSGISDETEAEIFTTHILGTNLRAIEVDASAYTHKGSLEVESGTLATHLTESSFQLNLLVVGVRSGELDASDFVLV